VTLAELSIRHARQWGEPVCVFDVRPDLRSIAKLARLTRVLSGRRVALGAGLVAQPLTADDWRDHAADEFYAVTREQAIAWRVSEAVRAQSAQSLSAARFQLEQFLIQAPDITVTHAALGDMAWENGQPDDALAAYDRAVTARPDDDEAVLSRALLQMEMGRLEQAQADLARLIHLSPEEADLWELQGKLRAARGLARQADADLDQATKLAPLKGGHESLRLLLALANDDRAAFRARCKRCMADLQALNGPQDETAKAQGLNALAWVSSLVPEAELDREAYRDE
jgi:predicted Zn-dependent protease